MILVLELREAAWALLSSTGCCCCHCLYRNEPGSYHVEDVVASGVSPLLHLIHLGSGGVLTGHLSGCPTSVFVHEGHPPV